MSGFEKRNMTFHASFQKGIKNIFQLASYIIIGGCIMDAIAFADTNAYILYLNLATIIVSSVSLTLYYTGKIEYSTGFIIVIYAILSNLFIGKFVYDDLMDNALRLNFFLRDSLFVVLLITLAAFTIHRIHALLIGFLFIIICIFFSRSVNMPFLKDSLVLLSFVFISYCGLIWYLVGIFEKVNRDQREQGELIHKQSDELLKRNSELGQLNRSKDLLMSVIGHDLKNPFNIIQLSTQILIADSKKLSEEKKKDIIAAIDRTASKTYLLLENLLNWARLQTRSIKFTPEPVGLKNIIRNCLELSSESISMKKITIEFQFENEYLVYADRNMVSTIVRNLVSNAVKFTGDGGHISIQCENSSNKVKCTITDNGIGLKIKELENLFNIDNLNVGKGTGGETGTGLGLILCREFLAMNQGTLEVESKEGIGSKFSFTLPAAEYAHQQT